MSNRDKEDFNIAGSVYRLSSQPVVTMGSVPGEEMTELPRSYGQPVVVAIARDPESIFVYWDIDWSEAFAGAPPTDRTIHLRIYNNEDVELKRILIEPLANNCDVRVEQPGNSLRVELGYFFPDQEWRAVGASEIVTMPRDKIGALAAGDFALVPFHITFQRLTELFRGTTHGDPSLTKSLARLQEKVERHDALTHDEDEIFRAMEASMSQRDLREPVEFDSAKEIQLQKKLERILGFGATSPKNPFNASSRNT